MYLPTIFAYQSDVWTISHSQTTEKRVGAEIQLKRGKT